MDVIYKFAVDNLIQDHQILNLQESSLKTSPSLEFDPNEEAEFFKLSGLSDIHELHNSAFSDTDIQFLYRCIKEYPNLNREEKNVFHSKLKFFFIKSANLDVFQQIIENLNSPDCINDFSKILLSSISIKPDLLNEYNQIMFPNVAIHLMNKFPEVTFPSLIIIITKTLNKFDQTLLIEVKKLLELSRNPYFYGIIIYRLAELAIENQNNQFQLISSLEYLFSQQCYKYPLKTVFLLSLNNHSVTFFNAFKKIFSAINEHILADTTLDNEDILNSLSFILQFAIHVLQIPQLCKEINTDVIASILTDNSDKEIKIKSLYILVNLIQHPSFQTKYQYSFYIKNIEEILTDLPFPLRQGILDIYIILAEKTSVSHINLLVTDFFTDFIFEIFGSDDPFVIQKAINVSLLVASKSPAFSKILKNEIEESSRMMQYYETFFEHLNLITHEYC